FSVGYAVLVICGCIYAAAATTTKFDFGTLTLSTMKLLGDAHLSNGSFRLTREVGVPYSGAGRVVYSKPVIFRRPGFASVASFSSFFTFSVTNLNPSSIGGGLAFVISPDGDRVGDSGGYLGIMKEDSSGNGVLAVEFDTQMDVEFKDINGNHVGLDLGSMISTRVGDLDAAGVNLKSGDLVNSWVEYSGAAGEIKVFVSYSNSKPKQPIITASIDLDKYLQNDSMFVGFSGSTQGSTEIHTIEWWSFTSSFDEVVGIPSSAAASTPENPPPTPPSPFFLNPISESSQPPPTSAASPAPGNKCHNQRCRNRVGTFAGVATAGAFLLGFCGLALLWAYNKKYKQQRNGESPITLSSDVIKMPREFPYKAIHAATRGFHSSRIIGHGAFGTVFKGILPETGDLIAVKRCGNSGQGKTEFLSELSIIATLRHRNLIRLQGWCHERGENLLIYDLMANGSLDKALFESRAPLPWLQRKKILLGVASALSYLHQECENQVIHRDIKTSNIMLDDGFNARLGDFGLARQIEHDKSPNITAAAGTMGYLAPEYLITGRATEKTDVFSYGAVVLEVASGRRPIEKEISGVGVSSNLVDWVWTLHREGRLTAAADPRLGIEFEEADMRKILSIGLSCSHPDPVARPRMRAVVQMLTGEADIPAVPKIKPKLSFTTSELLLTLQDSVSDLNGMIGISTSSSENSFSGAAVAAGTSGHDL
ncbi:lectin receptor kinase-like protein, partial [Genlisea aurea]